MILLALLLFEDLICWNDRYIQLYLLAVSIDIYQVEYINEYIKIVYIFDINKSYGYGKSSNSATSTTYRSLYKILFGGTLSGADTGFQVRGAHLKKLRRAEGGK